MEYNDSKIMKENELLKRAIDLQINETEQLLVQKAEFQRVSKDIIKMLSRYADTQPETQVKFGFEGNVGGQKSIFQENQQRAFYENQEEDFGFQPRVEEVSELQDQLQALSKENFFLKDQSELNNMKIAGYEHKIGDLSQKVHKLEAENHNLNKQLHQQAEELSLLKLNNKKEESRENISGESSKNQEGEKQNAPNEELAKNSFITADEAQMLKDENNNLKKEIHDLRDQNLQLLEKLKHHEARNT